MGAEGDTIKEVQHATNLFLTDEWCAKTHRIRDHARDRNGASFQQ